MEELILSFRVNTSIMEFGDTVRLTLNGHRLSEFVLDLKEENNIIELVKIPMKK